MTDALKISLCREKFRLRYALAAASVHQALTQGVNSEEAAALLLGANEQLIRAIDHGELVVESLSETTDALSQSVRTFLADLMLPSMHVLRAGAALELDRLDAPAPGYSDKHEAAIKQVAKGRRLTWRVQYNLACYYASSDRPAEALRHLQNALAGAPSAEVVGLASWAGRDPSLAGLRKGEWFNRTQRLLHRFTGTLVAQPASLADLDGVGPLGAEQLGRLGIDAPSDLANSARWSDLAKAMEVPVGLGKHWLGVVDLAGVPPLRTADVNALIRAGAGSTAILAASDTTQLLAKLKGLGDRAPSGWTPPTETELDHWIMAARRRQVKTDTSG